MADFEVPANKIHDVKDILVGEDLNCKALSNNTGFSFERTGGGKVVIYKTGKVVIQGPTEEAEFLRTLFFEKCGNLCRTSSSEKPKKDNMLFKYSVPVNEILLLQSYIIDYCNSNSLNYSEQPRDRSMYYRYQITDASGGKIMLTQYSTGTFMLQGKRTVLWDVLVEAIGLKLGKGIQTFVAQVLAEPGEEIDVVAIVTTADATNASCTVQKALGKCYDFLESFDQDLIDSSQYMLNIGIQPKECFGFVSGTIRAIEGFAKKFLIEIGAFPEEEVINSRGENAWHFGKVYVSETKTLTPEVVACLSSDKALANQQNEAIKNLLTGGIYKYRHNQFHNSPPPIVPNRIKSLSKAKEIHDEILYLMAATYKSFEAELTQ